MIMTATIALQTDELTVHVCPEKGGDITAIIDRARGINVLFTTPWRPLDEGNPEPSADSSDQDSSVPWLSAYTGGWQTLIPNAGPERDYHGVRQDYHGEASVRGWTVIDQSDTRIELEVELTTAPLRLRRTITVSGSSVSVDAVVTNTSPDPVSFRWVEHPAFGAPFIDQDAYIETDARLLVTDAVAPGTVLPADSMLEDPFRRSEIADVSRFPQPGVPRSVFAALGDFTEGRATIVSPNVGLAVTIAWDCAVFPFAWYWQELNESPGFPWFQRAYVAAVEPANVLPGEGTIGPYQRGEPVPIPGNGTIETRLTVSSRELSAN